MLCTEYIPKYTSDVTHNCNKMFHLCEENFSGPSSYKIPKRKKMYASIIYTHREYSKLFKINPLHDEGWLTLTHESFRSMRWYLATPAVAVRGGAIAGWPVAPSHVVSYFTTLEGGGTEVTVWLRLLCGCGWKLIIESSDKDCVETCKHLSIAYFI